MEESEYKLASRVCRIYKTKLGPNTPALTWNAICKNCDATYKFTIENFPNDTDNYVKVIVHRFKDHQHEQDTHKTEQIRGNERLKVAEKIILNDSSPAHNHYMN